MEDPEAAGGGRSKKKRKGTRLVEVGGASVGLCRSLWSETESELGCERHR